MKLTLLQKILALSTVNKAFAFKHGALVCVSLPLSIGLLEALKQMVKDVVLFDLILPVISIAMCLCIYFVFWLTDFFWGLIAAKHENNNDNPDWIQSDKLYSSLGKIGGILLMNVLLLPLILFLLITNFETISFFVLIITVLINLLSILYEVHSIGENIKRKTGKKPAMYTFFEQFTSLLESTIIKKIRSLLGASNKES
ncbi:hypothetical protein ES692_06075 [Psychroserpens burtonensis]|uniref:Phage holin family protein n=1 Tax=Psychroserpens burtonensis TaxID=49278 RepID=A0A5C7B907_9FLAO|nr:phage holin family protein [Psychroserpens burtonensis]TXE18608.1 hypothetical protein ES692_06075 [Psychroserpens burtonensis]